MAQSTVNQTDTRLFGARPTFAAAGLSDDFFEANLVALGLPPLTADRVRAAAPSGRLQALPDGTPVIERTGALLGAPSPGAELDNALRSAAPGAPIVVFGLGTGHTLRDLRARTEAPIVVYEPDPGILKTLLSHGPADLVGVDIVCNSHDLSQLWPQLAHREASATLVKTPGYPAAFAEEYEKVHDLVVQLVQRTGVNDNTYKKRARLWLECVFDNLELLCESPMFLGLEQRYRNVPAFIVSAGPSLGNNGALLAEAAQKGIVIAVNSSARAVHRYGAEPHVLACVESIDVSHLLCDVPYLDRCIRAYSLAAHPRTLRYGRGPLLPVYEGLPQLDPPLLELTGFRGLPVCGSVSTVAFSLAQRLGCSPIVLTGQDLAYTDGRAYAPGSVYEDSRVRVSEDGHELLHEWSDALKQTNRDAVAPIHEREPLERVPAWGGTGSVASGIGFSAIRAWFETAAQTLVREAPEQVLVNATEGGARIEGFAERRLSEVLAELPVLDIETEDIARAAHAAAPPLDRARVAEWAERQRELTSQIRRRARRVRLLAERCDRAIARDDAGAIRRGFAKLDQAELELVRAVRAAPLVDVWSYAALDETRGHGDAERDDRARAVAAIAAERHMASAIESASSELAGELDKLARALRGGARTE